MSTLVPREQIEHKIILIRGHKVMLDADLAAMYGVTTFNLNKAVKRNIDRFPEDFMFQLRTEEATALRFQIGMSKTQGRGGRRYAPNVFTEQGVAMLSSVLSSERASASNGYGASLRNHREPSRDWRVETRGKETYLHGRLTD